MPGDDPRLLVVPGSVAGQLEDLSSQILHDGGQVDRGSSANPLGVVTLTEQPGLKDKNYYYTGYKVWSQLSPVDTAHWELETSAAGPGLGLHLGLATFTTAGHCEDRLVFLSETQKPWRNTRVMNFTMSLQQLISCGLWCGCRC